MNDELKNEKNDVTDEIVWLFEEFKSKVIMLTTGDFVMNCGIVAMLVKRVNDKENSISGIQNGKTSMLHQVFDKMIEWFVIEHKNYVVQKLLMYFILNKN